VCRRLRGSAFDRPQTRGLHTRARLFRPSGLMARVCVAAYGARHLTGLKPGAYAPGLDCYALRA
jgi:hypothetical protein